MIAEAGLLDFIYVGIILGNMVLLAVLWPALSWLFGEAAADGGAKAT